MNTNRAAEIPRIVAGFLVNDAVVVLGWIVLFEVFRRWSHVLILENKSEWQSSENREIVIISNFSFV